MLKQGPSVMDVDGLRASDGISTSTQDEQALTEDEFLTRSREAYRHSKTWFDQSVRPKVQKAISHFRSQHDIGSKYHHQAFRARSNVFRPKTRSVVRRTEAAVAVALFATADVLDLKPWNEDDPAQVAQAKACQKALQYRLEHTMPWFLTACGAVQDAAVSGVAIGHIYWEYRKTTDSRYEVVESDDGAIDIRKVDSDRVTANHPVIDLVPVENFRVDPASDWRDPVNSSPYTIHDVPTFVGEVRRMIAEAGLTIDETRLWAAAENDLDSIRTARAGTQIDKYANSSNVPDYRTVWVRKHIHRIDGMDWYWETIADLVMLREPEPLEDAFPHLIRLKGRRPYVFGFSTLETHKPYPDSSTMLLENLQEEINDVANLRLDSSKNAMFGRFTVKRGRNVDTATLKAGIPQSVIAVDDHDALRELKQADVGQASFASEDRLNTDFDELAGNFSLASVASNRQMNETVGGMNLLSSDASQVKEFEIRVFTETWVEPVLRQLHALEAAYEDDVEVLTRVALQAGQTPAQVQQALSVEGSLRVNVGFNATSPDKRINRLLLGVNTALTLFPEMRTNAASAEIIKEIFGALGYADGQRFFPVEKGQDPEKEALKQQVAQLMQMLQGKQMELESRERIAQGTNESRERVASLNARVQMQLGVLAHGINARKSQLEEVDRMLAGEENEIRRGELRLQREALSHEINESNRQAKLLMSQPKAGPKGEKGGKGAAKKPAADGAPVLEGDDKAGIISRDDFAAVPFAEG